jgi:hypothetical protein
VIVELENGLTVMDCDLSPETEITIPLKKLTLVTPPISISTRLSPSLSPRTKSPHSPTQLELGFAGSFQESLLSGHMSSMKSSVCTGFIANLSASSCSRNTAEHVKIPFDAHHYHVEDSVPPYVASIFLPKGRYRIAPVGKIQLTIFNPNKTPIKTLLVRYDFSDMPPCSKSFIRQIIKTGSPAILQYATHFRVTCSKRGRIYLRDSIRIVFPLRQPDEHHQLDISYQYPDNPRYYPC